MTVSARIVVGLFVLGWLLVVPTADPRAGAQCACCEFPDDGDGDGVCFDVDNCPTVFNPSQTDGDGDGRGDACDNCLAIQNGPWAYAAGLAPISQCDRDSDGYGNACDGDFDGNGFVTPLDAPSYLAALPLFIPPTPGEHDLDCNGFMTPLDGIWMRAQLAAFFPGPSGRACAGMVGSCPPLP